MLAWLFNDTACKDEVVINDRWGSDTRHQHGGYWTTEYGAGLQNGSHAWEENRGMAYSFGYNRAERADDYKSAREFVLMLVDLVSRGGNFLLDVGPKFRRHHPAADGGASPRDRCLAQGQRRGYLRHALRRFAPANGAMDAGPGRSTANSK